MRFRFLHAADLHLDTPFAGLHRIDGSLVNTLRDATPQAFANLVSAAIQERVAFVLIAGDVYDGPERGVRAQLAFRDGLERLATAGIRCFVVHGNHDPVDEGWSAIRSWPKSVTVFGANEVESVPVEWGGQTVAVVHGISYPRRQVTENLARRIRKSSTPCLQVGVLHCNVGSNAEHAAYSPCSVDDLVEAGLDYWALGHVHTRQMLRSGDPWIAYPGNTQGLSLKASERGPKGALLVDVEDGHVARVTFLPLDTVRFDELEVDITEHSDVGALADAITEAARRRTAGRENRTTVLRTVLNGRGDLHADLRRGRAREQLLESVRSTLAADEPPVWLDSIEDLTRPMLDLGAVRGRGDFASDLVAAADSANASLDLRRELLASQLADLPHDLRRLVGEELEAAPTEDEVNRALVLALDYVVEPEP